MLSSHNRFVTLRLAAPVAAGLLAAASTAASGQDLTTTPDDPEGLTDADRVLWSGSGSLGLTGATGNTERLNFRSELLLSRDTARFETDLAAVYHYATDEGNKNTNRFDGRIRNDWLIEDSPWRYYARARYEYDEFQDWLHRVSGGPGVGYLWSKTEKLYFLTRGGVDLSREFGGEDNTITPEGVLGFDLEYHFSDRQRLTWVFDFLPSLSELGPYRFETNAAYHIDLDPANGLFLKLGIEDRYDSTPGAGRKRNDLVYFVTLGWQI